MSAMSSSSADLRSLAHDLGVTTSFHGFDGTVHEVPDATLTKVLAALGHEIADEQDVHRCRRELELDPWRRPLPPVLVLREGREASVPVHVTHGSDVEVQALLEDGEVRSLTQVRDDTPAREVDGRTVGRARFAVPSDLPLGWHRLIARSPDGIAGSTAACDLVVTPERLTVHEHLGARRALGIQAQLYSVRSATSWGIGDLADARDLAAILGHHHGMDFLLVNPLHATAPRPPVIPSPYLPVTRRFTTMLAVRPEDVPEFAGLPDHARQRIRLLQAEVATWNDRADRIERDAVLAAKTAALEELFAAPRTAAREALLTAYREREGEGLTWFALWCALTERAQEAGARGEEPEAWVCDALADANSPAAQRALTELADRVDFHAWVQWVLDQQLTAAQQAARDAGMRIGLMHDLAVGVTQHGADAWRLREVVARGIGVGAPADQYNQQGQNWDQPPWKPQALAEAGYRPWRDMLRSLMRHAGALRIDHVLGLFRLWWVPEGNIPADGAYVSYDHEAMIGILALEAQRAGTVVVGEDLGTFEPWVREYLQDRGILGTSILWFENDAQGSPLPPATYRRLCLASVNTHDLPPTAGYLAGEHVRLRSELGLLERPLAEEIAIDAAARERVLERLRADGLLPQGAAAEQLDTESIVIALHRYLARTPSLLLGVSLVDCVGETRIQNQPGTDQEYPNWRIPLADADGRVMHVEDLAHDPRTTRLLGAVRAEIEARG